ncbi:hypothetical protein TDE_0331 [Treponema denticola ATCC 35405]|uniref:Uncharacterized protein n=1 Tax=Treponema denticola (strain ATCC 35405 / DSM 14222 / CIP 103919 / JCM 8153 / KCTC 15104) TaxID=243275 RepID=Q73QW2_TREDE|nr:hypothetical protein TDE_0331 [Treponema denticola ATCC 35405]
MNILYFIHDENQWEPQKAEIFRGSIKHCAWLSS